MRFPMISLDAIFIIAHSSICRPTRSTILHSPPLTYNCPKHPHNHKHRLIRPICSTTTRRSGMRIETSTPPKAMKLWASKNSKLIRKDSKRNPELPSGPTLSSLIAPSQQIPKKQQHNFSAKTKSCKPYLKFINKQCSRLVSKKEQSEGVNRG
jgi:hypothetical protein